jgi:hypothetical protein
VTLTRWLECNGVEQPNVTDTCTGTADTARYLRVHVTKDFQGEFYFSTIRMTASGALRTQ